MEKRLVHHEKTPVAVWENAWCSMKKRLVHHEKTLGISWNSERCE